MLQDLGLELVINDTPVEVLGTINTSIEHDDHYSYDGVKVSSTSTCREVEEKWVSPRKPGPDSPILTPLPVHPQGCTPDRRAIGTPLIDGVERVGDRSCVA